jgi:Ring finger domain
LGKNDFAIASCEPKLNYEDSDNTDYYSQVCEIIDSSVKNSDVSKLSGDSDNAKFREVVKVSVDLTSEINDDCAIMIKVPLSGEPEPTEDEIDIENVTERRVPAVCVICLSSFQSSDRIIWSSNVDCCHVFHEKCILDWFRVFGRDKFERARRERSRQSQQDVPTNSNSINTFPFSCPICRQDFIAPYDRSSSDAPM